MACALANDAPDGVEEHRAQVAVVILAPPGGPRGRAGAAVGTGAPDSARNPMSLHVGTLPQKEPRVHLDSV